MRTYYDRRGRYTGYSTSAGPSGCAAGAVSALLVMAAAAGGMLVAVAGSAWPLLVWHPTRAGWTAEAIWLAGLAIAAGAWLRQRRARRTRSTATDR
jgi:hypothetical protein